MSGTKKDASEQWFQEQFVRELEKYKWDSPDFLDGTKKEVTVADLENHWREELNRINADQLEGVPLSDAEFKQILAKVKQIANSYEAAKILSIEEGKGKIDGIYRDDHPNVTRKQITLTIFKKADVRGGVSGYRIAREVWTEKGNRFDIVLLINGLPLINIELKRTDKTLEEAFGQFMRYYRDGEYSNNFMAFSQMMVIASEIDARYFATPKSMDAFNRSFVFRWSDENNVPITRWDQFVRKFLYIPMAHQMVGDYLVIDEAKDEENRRHMLMRPYQVYALRAIENAAFGRDKTELPHGGYVWHTTGSGKTITSFKTALFLSTRGGFDKVVFLVDRRELDNRTSENFKAYAEFESVTVDDTKYTYVLGNRLRSSKTGIIVTTTYKLHSLIKELNETQDWSLAEKKIVFIIDEAHRTTMGNMMGTIQRYFRKNGIFFGFTGTPLFDENEVKGMIDEKSELINTTEKLFGPQLHQYTIDEAISDGNVLGFHVDYINTGEFKSYEDLRDQLIERIVLEQPDQALRSVERLVYGWDETEVERQAQKYGILQYRDETHIPRVVEEILRNWDSQSQERKFNAILTVAYKERVLSYYEEFRKQLREKKIDLNVAMTFSFGNENDPDAVSEDITRKMFKEYAEFTGIEFVAGDPKQGEQAYFEDLVERATRGGSGRNPKNIDLIIVADQLLTGYDSKYLNTLYVDRKLALQGLIQAYSRTNRVYGPSKKFGSIVNFQYPRLTEERVNRALELYGSGGKNSRAIVEPYATAVEKWGLAANSMMETLADPTDWLRLRDDPIRKEAFLSAFREAADRLNLVQQYYEYVWDETTFNLDEHTWLQYVGAYKNLITRVNGPEPPPPPALVGKTKLVGTQVIDAAHILSLIGSKADRTSRNQTVDPETLRLIREEIQELSNMGDHEQANLLREFVDTELVSGNVSSSISIDEAFNQWKKECRNRTVVRYAEDWGLDSDLLNDSIDAYSSAQPEYVPNIDELIARLDYEQAKKKAEGGLLTHNMKLMKELPLYVREIKEKFK